MGKLLAVLVACYLVVCPFTDLVNLDMRTTDWLNILTYAWLLIGFALVTGLAFVVGFLQAAMEAFFNNRRMSAWKNMKDF